MNYEIVTLAEKTVIGFSARTNNTSPDMEQVIGNLWKKFYSEEGYPAISKKTGSKAMGIYTDYASNETGDYTVMVACEAESNTTDSFDVCKIPFGRYAKFIVKGNMLTAVQKFWQELWKMDLDRSFICDFEEYQNSDCENAEIHIYIGLK